MPEEVILFWLRSSLSKFGTPLNASSGMEVMEFPRTGSSCIRHVHIYIHVCECMNINREKEIWRRKQFLGQGQMHAWKNNKIETR
jgi:hypothetical protein